MQFPGSRPSQPLPPTLNRPIPLPQASTSTLTPSQSLQTNGAPQQTTKRTRPPLSKKGLFAKELGPMMYGFGDAAQPNKETIELMEELLVDYIAEIASAAHKVSSNKRKMKLEDVRFALRSKQTSKQLSRADELVKAAAEVKKMREIGKVSYGKFSKEGEDGTEGQTPGGTANNDGKPAKPMRNKDEVAAKRAAAAARRLKTGKPGPGRPRKDKSKP